MKKLIKPYYYRFINFLKTKKEIIQIRQGNNRFIVIASPTHGNLGDHAIVKAEIDFLNKYFPNREIVEISFDDYYSTYKSLKKNLSNSDVIIFPGGGNLGDVYQEEEDLRRHVIKNFLSNRIVIFPQTIHFNKKLEFDKTIRLYNSHNKLTVCARESKSYEILRSNLSNVEVLLVPDIVISQYSYFKPSPEDRKLISTFIRSDLESNLSQQDKSVIELVATKLSSKYNLGLYNSDTVVSYPVALKDRDKEVSQKWDEFKKSKLVITDRLHGMIFAFITRTPCIAFGNYNYKVKGVYKWIEKCPYIYYLESTDNLYEKCNELINTDTSTFYGIESEFNPLVESLKGDSNV